MGSSGPTNCVSPTVQSSQTLFQVAVSLEFVNAITDFSGLEVDAKSIVQQYCMLRYQNQAQSAHVFLTTLGRMVSVSWTATLLKMSTFLS